MPTDKQIEASRQNGAKSHGPTTPEGRQRSAQNATKHGLCSRQVLLPDENPDDLHALEVHWMRQLRPQTAAERELANHVVLAAWRMQRYERAETSLLAIEMEKHPGDPNAIGHAFNALAAASPALSLLNRYAGRARRDFKQALQTYHDAVDRRAQEHEKDRRQLSAAAFMDVWGIEPEKCSTTHFGRCRDILPNEPEYPGIYTPMFNEEEAEAA